MPASCSLRDFHISCTMAITEKGEAVITHDLEAPTLPNEGIGDATQQDEIDMHRLGRKPQLKVGQTASCDG